MINYFFFHDNYESVAERLFIFDFPHICQSSNFWSYTHVPLSHPPTMPENDSNEVHDSHSLHYYSNSFKISGQTKNTPFRPPGNRCLRRIYSYTCLMCSRWNDVIPVMTLLEVISMFHFAGKTRFFRWRGGWGWDVREYRHWEEGR